MSSVPPDLSPAPTGDVAMKFFPATAATVYERPPMRRADLSRQGRPTRLPPAPSATLPPDIIWSEAAGEFIDLAVNASDVAQAFVKPSAPAAHAGRILVVDDDVGIREVLANILRHAGYHVECAEDGEAGWDSLCAESYDLLITDFAMPRLTGAGLLQRLREARRDLPAILISGDPAGQEGELAPWLKPGVSMAKPFSGVEVLAAVRELMFSHDARTGAQAGATNREPGVPSPTSLIVSRAD